MITIYCSTCAPTLPLHPSNWQQNQGINYYRHCRIFTWISHAAPCNSRRQNDPCHTFFDCGTQVCSNKYMWLTISSNWSCKSNIYKWANNRIQPTLKRNITTHTKTRSAGKVPNTHFHGCPIKPHCNNFHGCSTEKFTHNYKTTQVTINSADDQEPIAKRTRSSIDTANLRPTQAIQNLN